MSSSAERKMRRVLPYLGWLPVRAAGSLGAVDIVAMQGPVPDGDAVPAQQAMHPRVELFEVKETSRTLADGEGVVRPTESSGDIADQLHLLRELAAQGFRCSLVHRQKGQHPRHNDWPRWAVHRILPDVDPTAPLHQSEGEPFLDYIRRRSR